MSSTSAGLNSSASAHVFLTERLPMRIVFTSDLHIDVSERQHDAVTAITRVIRERRPDVVVVAGDAGNTIAAIEETLSFFSQIDARKFFIPGNHDVWIETENDNLIDCRVKYAERIPEACRKKGFHDLGREPVVLGNVGFVGSLGWYDYSFADPRLGMSEEDYWRGRYGDEIWWDKKMTYWMPPRRLGTSSEAGKPAKERMSDTEVCAEMCTRLDAHLGAIEKRVETIVAVIHTLPFFVGLPRSDPPHYLDAYTGSERLGRILEAHLKVEHCIHGHKHTSGDWTVGQIRVHRRALGRVNDECRPEEIASSAVGFIEV